MAPLEDIPCQIGILKVEPIAARSAFGENASADPAETITPREPAASAERITAPRFDGLLTSERRTRVGMVEGLELKAIPNECLSSAGREQISTTPCELFVSAIDENNR